MHSTETALLKVQYDLLRNLDDGKTTVLVLLDLSAAFDQLDHSGVISLLENWIGISGNAFRWFALYCKSGNIREVLIFANFARRKNSKLPDPQYLIDRQKMVKVKECVGEPFQSMVFPRDLSLGRSFSHSIQHLLVK